MTNQEILIRMFIHEFIGWGTWSEEHLKNFDRDYSLASRIAPLFPRENEPESFEGYVYGDVLKDPSYYPNFTVLRGYHDNYRSKVKITILDS